MQNTKRLFSLFLAIAMVLGMIPGAAAIAEECVEPESSAQVEVSDTKLQEESAAVEQEDQGEEDAQPVDVQNPEDDRNSEQLLAAAAEVELHEEIALRAGSDIFTPGNLGSSEFGNVKEMFKGSALSYNGWQLMEVRITIPKQEGVLVTNVVPSVASLYPEYSVLEDGADAYTYSYYVKDNGTYDFQIEYTVNGVPTTKNVQYTLSGMIYIPDITMRAYLLQAIDPNKYQGYITEQDVREGRYYLSADNYTSDHQIDPGCFGGPDYYFAYVKDLTGVEYMTTMRQINFYSSYFYKSQLDVQTLEPMTHGYYPNMTRFQLTGPYDADTKLSPDAYDSELLGKVLTRMPNLTEFSANRTGFKNFEAFGEMNGKLDFLACKQNGVTSLHGLENHTELRNISLNVNQISDLTPLKNIPQAGQWNFIQNRIADLTPISNVKVTRQIHFGYQSVQADPVQAVDKGATYELELPMPIDIDGTLTKVGFAQFIASSSVASHVPVEQRDKLLVVYGPDNRKLYPVVERDGKSYVEIPKADVPNADTNAAFENAVMRFWFENDNGSDSRTRGAFNGNVDFTVAATPTEYTVDYQFVSADGQTALPQEVLDQLPAAQTVHYGDTVKIPADVDLHDVKTESGTWTFVGWDKDEITGVTGDDHFTGTWNFILDAFTINHRPEIMAEDKTLTVGDTFAPLDGVTASDKENGDLTDRIQIVHNTVDVSKAGTYEITYQVTDRNGLSVTKTVTVTVCEAQVTPGPEKPNTPSNTPGTPNTSDPASNTDQQNQHGATPQTGDNSPVLLWAVIAVLAVGGIVVLLVIQKRKNGKK